MGCISSTPAAKPGDLTVGVTGKDKTPRAAAQAAPVRLLILYHFLDVMVHACGLLLLFLLGIDTGYRGDDTI